MDLLPKTEAIADIIAELRTNGIIENTDYVMNNLVGTTAGLVYTLSTKHEVKYVIKLDLHQQISLVEQLLLAYRHSPLLPKLIYTDPRKKFIIYTYIKGTTHYKRGSKINWLSLLIHDLINLYENYQETNKWGCWLEEPCETWRDFIDQGVEYARVNVGSILPIEDYYLVKLLVENISIGESNERFLLHGDLGVHNFVFDQNTLAGVIDPSPITGPIIYDFLYAFCSSPDDLNLETLLKAFALLEHKPIEESKLMEEVIIQLYCRIGICLLHHPDDLTEYLKAWDYWKEAIKWKVSLD
jgi:hypothetical protein